MSKSHPDPKSRILLTDSDEDIAARIKSAVTDSLPNISYDPTNRPGLSNLLSIYSGLDADGTSPEDIAARYTGASDKGRLKEDLTELIVEHLKPIKDRYARLRQDLRHLSDVELIGAARAKEVASETLLRVKTSIGLA